VGRDTARRPTQLGRQRSNQGHARRCARCHQESASLGYLRLDVRHPLIGILILAAVLRLWGLADQPVLYFDSGQYLGEAQFLSSAARLAFGALVQPGAGAASANPLERIVRAADTGTQAHAPDNAKVGHAILLAISMLIFGTSAFAAVLVSALAAIGTVAATYAIGALGWGRRIAIPAALLLAVSGWHLTYSREAYAEADMVLFATLAYLVYLRFGLAGNPERLSALLGAGVLFGLAFACNTRAAYALLVVAPLELTAWRARGWRLWHPTLRRALALGLGFLAPVVLIEGAYLLARSLGRTFGAAVSWPDYAQQLAAYWQQHPVIIRVDQWPTFFVDLALLDGMPVLVLVLIGVAWALGRSKGPVDVLFLTALLAPVALYSVYVAGAVRMRAFSLALPWIMLAAALGLDALVLGVGALLRRRQQPLFLGVATAGLVVLALPRGIELMSAPNGVPAMLAYLDQAHETDIASTDGPILGFYVGEQHTNAKFRAAYINSPADLVDLAGQYRLLAVEMQGYLFPNEVAQRYVEVPPVFSAPHGSPTWYLASLLENRGVRWAEWDLLLADWQRYRVQATELRLEDLRELAQAP